jgi:hypothetical protein
MITLIFTLMGILGMLTAYLFISQSARIRDLEYRLDNLTLYLAKRYGEKL